MHARARAHARTPYLSLLHLGDDVEGQAQALLRRLLGEDGLELLRAAGAERRREVGQLERVVDVDVPLAEEGDALPQQGVEDHHLLDRGQDLLAVGADHLGIGVELAAFLFFLFVCLFRRCFW